MTAGDRREQEPRLKKVVIDFWFAVQSLGARRRLAHSGGPHELPPDDDAGGADRFRTSGVPRRPPPSAESAPVELSEPSEDASP